MTRDPQHRPERAERLRESLGRGRRGAVGEERYRVRRVRGATFFTSRVQHEDLTVVVKRFPRRSDGDAGGDGAAGASGRPFVLVHGIGVSSRYYQPLAAELARDGEVWLVDLPGYGAAPDPKRDVTIADHAAALGAMLDASGVQQPVVVGHSMGTQVVAALAEAQPDLTDRLVLMAPTMEPAARTPARAIGRLLLDALREPPAVFFIAVTDYLVRCGLPYLLRQLPKLLDDRLETRLPTLDARVLVVNGDRDPIVPDAWARSLADSATQASFAHVHGTHVVMHTDPRRIATVIRTFLDTDGRPDAVVDDAIDAVDREPR